MKVSPINNNTVFKATLPPYIKKSKNDKYYDYWPKLFEDCKKAGMSSEFVRLMLQLQNNERTGFLALEARKNPAGNDEINFRYYTDLLCKGEDLLAMSRSKTGNVTFENGEVSILRNGTRNLCAYIFNNGHVIGAQLAKTDNITKFILTTLKNILTPDTPANKAIFGELSETEQFLKRFRAKI